MRAEQPRSSLANKRAVAADSATLAPTSRLTVIIELPVKASSWKFCDPIRSLKVEPLLLEVADVVNTTLDLDTTLRRVAELVRKVIDYEIFAILLLNEKTQELRIRFQVGYPREVAERVRIKDWRGRHRTGGAKRAKPILVNDVAKDPELHLRRAQCALGAGGSADREEPGHRRHQHRSRARPVTFTEEHKRLLTLIGSRMAVGIENARLHTRTTRQARTLLLLNEIARELTSILNVDELLKHIAELLSRLIDYQMFSILLLDASGRKAAAPLLPALSGEHPAQARRSAGRWAGGLCRPAQSRPCWFPDVSKDPRYILLNPETRSELAVPLIYKEKVIGVLDLEHTRRGFLYRRSQADRDHSGRADCHCDGECAAL